MPVVLTKSYSLPLWKRKTQQFSVSEVEDAAGSSAQLQSPEDNRVTIKVPIPTFVPRSSRSPNRRARSVSSSPIISKSPPSCLVYRSSSELVPSPDKPLPIPRPSLPIYQRRQDELTVPLRDCCADCERITEESLKEGDDWKEKFSRGARRRRSASLEYTRSCIIPPTPSHMKNARTFTPFSSEDSASGDLNSRFSTSAAFSIVVDEVDKRRKSFEYDVEDTDFIRALSPPSSSQFFHCSASPFASSSGISRYPQVKPHDREVSSSSTMIPSTSITDELLHTPDILDPRNGLRSSPIEEEDETQLFPLPKRSRSNTPSPSTSPNPSPAPSPNASTLFLPVLSSKWNSTQDNTLSSSLSRKTENGSMARSSISASLSSPSPSLHPEEAIYNIQPIPKASTTGKFRAVANPASPKRLPLLVTSKVLPTSSDTEDHTLQIPLTPSNTTLPAPEPESRITKSPPSSFITTFSNQTGPSQRKRKLSFTLPFIKAGGAIRDVGVDVLRGVSSMSGVSV